MAYDFITPRAILLVPRNYPKILDLLPGRPMRAVEELFFESQLNNLPYYIVFWKDNLGHDRYEYFAIYELKENFDIKDISVFGSNLHVLTPRHKQGV